MKSTIHAVHQHLYFLQTVANCFQVKVFRLLFWLASTADCDFVEFVERLLFFISERFQRKSFAAISLICLTEVKKAVPQLILLKN